MKREKNAARRPGGLRLRVGAVFLLLLAMIGLAVRSIATVSGDTEYVAAAGAQSIYRLDVASARGTIYDCNLRPLTGSSGSWIAAAAPAIETIGALETATGGQYRERLALALEDGKPFIMELDRPIEDDCIDMFRVPKRYSEDQLAPHVVGYLDSMGGGAAGVELCMNDALDLQSGQVTIHYSVDALGRVIAGADRLVYNTLDEANGGVAVTIDSRIQRIAEKASERLDQGAVVVTEVPGCQVRALVSRPDFDPNNIGEAVESGGQPLINRALCAYAPGSVFKLITAAAELENGSVLSGFDCTGSINAGGMLFNCYDGIPHGKLNLKEAIERSCNCYFISAARAMGGQPVLSLAYNLGLGEGQEFGRGLFSGAGTLPSGESLENVRALANFSFGQGELAVTPLQLCGMMNAIASGGTYSSPKLIEGLVSAGGELTSQHPVTDISRQAMSGRTASVLRAYLQSAAKEGTGKSGAPEGVECGIKTGTAQTGVYENGEELCNFWYCGFVSDGDGPRWCVTVLREGVASDEGVTAETFKEVCQGLGKLGGRSSGD